MTGSPAAPVARLSRPPRWRRREAATGALFAAPAVLGSVLLVIAPLIAVLWYSLHEWNVLAGTFRFVGAANYARLVADPAMMDALVASALFSLGVVSLNLVLSLTLAVLLNQKLPGTTLFRVLFFTPVVVSLVAWSIVWGFLLEADGGINSLLAVVGIDGPNWLRGGGTAMVAIVVVQVFKNVGLNMILFLAALQGVPTELHEAARIDGASTWRRFWSVTIPMIAPTILLVSILTVVGSLETFALIDVLTDGGPGSSTTVLVFYLYRQAFEFNSFGYASAISIVLFVLVLALTLLQWRLRRRWVFHEA